MVTSEAIDLKHLEQYTDGDAALLTEIMGLFREQVNKCLSTLDPDTNDQTWRDACHALKGAARGIGAWRLGDLAAEGEALIGDIDGVRESRPKFLQKLGECAQDVLLYADEKCSIISA